MTIPIDLLSLEQNTPGYARLAVRKWQGSSEELEFCIQRNQDSHYLQAGQQWSNNAFWFKVARFNPSADGQSIETQVGPEVVDPLLVGSSSAIYRLKLRSQDGLHGVEGVIARKDQNVLPSTASGTTRSTDGSAQLCTQPDIPNLPELSLPEDPVLAVQMAELPVTPNIEPLPLSRSMPTELQKRSWLWPVILLLLVLLSAAAAAWFWFNKNTAEPTNNAAITSASNIAEKNEVATPVSSCAAENMTSLSELVFVQGCVKQAPSSAELLEVIATAKAGKHCGIAQRLYANRSQSGDVDIAKAYAREYDPKYHETSECFAEPDAATAAYWYETILGYAPNDAEAKQRFEELKP